MNSIFPSIIPLFFISNWSWFLHNDTQTFVISEGNMEFFYRLHIQLNKFFNVVRSIDPSLLGFNFLIRQFVMKVEINLDWSNILIRFYQVSFNTILKNCFAIMTTEQSHLFIWNSETSRWLSNGIVSSLVAPFLPWFAAIALQKLKKGNRHFTDSTIWILVLFRGRCGQFYKQIISIYIRNFIFVFITKFIKGNV